MNFKPGLIAILAFVSLIFLAQNYESVTVSFLFWEMSMSLAVLIFFILLTGFVIGWLLHSFLSYRNDKKSKQV